MTLTRRILIRRMLFAGAAIAVKPLRATECGGPLLDRAIVRAGGKEALQKGSVLKWTGKARVVAAGKVVDIRVSTTVAPFTYARSDSWPVVQGPKATRSLLLEEGGGWLIRDGNRVPMPPSILIHEKAQYALYGLMRLVTLCDPSCHLGLNDARREITVRHPAAPITVLAFDPDGRLAAARNQVPAPEGTAVLDQQIEFTDTITSSGGIHWPRRLKITQNGQPYFELELTSFDAVEKL